MLASGHPALRGYPSDPFLYKSKSLKLISCLRSSAFVCVGLWLIFPFPAFLFVSFVLFVVHSFIRGHPCVQRS
jgi:hypothetical protein